MSAEMIAAIAAAMSTPWWAAVALGMFMIFHFAWITRRDKSIEKRFGQQFDAIIEMENIRANADLEEAKALVGLESEVRHLVDAIHDCPHVGREHG